jgi:hypothetical protein
MTTFLSERGQVYKVGKYDTGSYSVPGLTRQGVLIRAIAIEDNDMIMLKSTINGNKIIYTAGASFGAVGISGEVLLGSASCLNAQGFQQVVDWFEKVRVSVSKTPVSLSAMGVAYNVYVTGLAVAQADPEFNVQGFTIVGTLAQPAVKK